MNSWGMGDKELMALRKKARKSIDTEKFMSKFSSEIESINSGSFSHKCKCPNPNHKGGQERTPSFYFSDKEGTFKCFGCGWNGDIFDIIALFKGMPADTLVEKYAEGKGLKLLAEDIEDRVKFDILDLKYELSIAIREYIKNYDGNKLEEEDRWIDSLSVRIDERFDKLSNFDYEEARSFYMQILLELSRRKI